MPANAPEPTPPNALTPEEDVADALPVSNGHDPEDVPSAIPVGEVGEPIPTGIPVAAPEAEADGAAAPQEVCPQCRAPRAGGQATGGTGIQALRAAPIKA